MTVAVLTDGFDLPSSLQLNVKKPTQLGHKHTLPISHYSLIILRFKPIWYELQTALLYSP